MNVDILVALMLDISSADISALNDEDLRSLVGLLCEAEARAHAVSTSCVTWGGNQNAPDGGIDVRVRAPERAELTGFLPRANVGFQVKKTDFTPGLIPQEMRPSGGPRESIKELIAQGGAYIIASSGTDASDSALNDRLRAMRTAVADVLEHDQLLLDFYDRNRLATWVRNHPGIMAWVRQRCGRALFGWQPYSGWAVSPDGVGDTYLLDEKVRLHTGITDGKGIDLTSGIARIRDILRAPRGVVRLAGLSGVGKTRLVQALFDERLGTGALDPAIVVYTDMNDNPSPQPMGMISDLVAAARRAIIVVDNCPPDLHRRVAELCRVAGSLVGAITIEYDVQDDEPEGTEVFRLEPSSATIVAQLIARRFPEMTRLDVDKIAEFSGGNARVALALANTLERHESVAGLLDEELFKRLFHQRQAHDNNLLKAAQACSLLYSFQGEALSGDEAELPKLGALVGLTPHQLFAKVAQLKQRDLVQRRSVWRAILPHAIANRLAKLALQEIPFETVEEQFNTERLLKSFTRRLGYLHESEDAVRIATRWLAHDGFLGNAAQLNLFGQMLFVNIAPVAPEATLQAIERALAGPNARQLINDTSFRNKIGAILRSLAYDAAVFDRCVSLLVPLALVEPTDDRIHPIGGALKDLFHIFLSGTHATVEQRVRSVDQLLGSSEPAHRELGRRLLAALFEANHFSATHSFEFGARVRDYGYWPRAREERVHWFVETLRLACKYAFAGDGQAFVRTKIANAIRSIWFLGPEVQDVFESFAAEIAEQMYWEEGWIAVRSILARPTDKEPAEAVDRLRSFEQRLKPKNIEEQVRAVVLTETWSTFDYAEAEDDEEEDVEDAKRPLRPYERANALAEELGKEIACDAAAFASLLPDLVVGRAQRLANFGKGLATGSLEPRAIWAKLVAALAQSPQDQQNGSAHAGFLIGLSASQPELCEALLEEALTDETLGAWFPFLQTAVPITPAGAGRLKRSLCLGIAHIGAYRRLGWGPASDALSSGDLRDIVLAVAAKEDGYAVAIDILSMRFHPDKDHDGYAPELVDAGRQLLSNVVFTPRDQSLDYHLQSIANVCLAGPDGAAATRAICGKIRQGFADYTFRAYSHEGLLSCLFTLQPRVALDAFFPPAPGDADVELDVGDFDDLSDRRRNPLDGVPLDEMLRWCDEAPEQRYPAISKVVSYYMRTEEEPIEWTPVALEMLNRARDPVVVLENFVRRFSPRSWSGSRAAIIESRTELLDRLPPSQATAFVDIIARLRAQLTEEIEQTRKWENERDRERDERFE